MRVGIFYQEDPITQEATMDTLAAQNGTDTATPLLTIDQDQVQARVTDVVRATVENYRFGRSRARLPRYISRDVCQLAEGQQFRVAFAPTCEPLLNGPN